ncbi:hypothetical protein, partial [Lysinibacillus sp. NPDC056232]|uniref:hypothetical protein n=1 Tax=Lysinibacillus sp. NPDC056232 TaxID=3345756 RepID=UPI0035DCE42F
GFLASFMLSDSIKVRTRDYRENKLIEVDIFKDNEYVSIKEQNDLVFKGTEIILDYEQFFNVFESVSEIEEYIRDNFLIKDIQIIVDIVNENRFQVKSYEDEKKLEIDLSKYLEDVDVTLYGTKQLSPNFIEYLDEVEKVKIQYCFDGLNVDSVIEKNISLNKFIGNNYMKLISFLEINDSSDLNEIIEAEEYIDDIEEYYRENYHDEDIVIAISPTIEYKKFPNGLLEGETIIEGLNFSDLEDLEDFYHDNSSGTFYHDFELDFFGIEGMNKYVEIKSNGDVKSAKLYVRNVFVEEAKLIFNNGIFFWRNKLKFKLNIYNKSIMPNVARNNLLKSDIKILSNSIQQALYLSILEEIKNPIEQMVFKEYIKKYHKYKNTLLKSEYKAVIDNL